MNTPIARTTLPACPLPAADFLPAALAPLGHSATHGNPACALDQMAAPNNLASSAFKRLSEPGWFSWAPHIYAPRVDFELCGQGLPSARKIKALTRFELALRDGFRNAGIDAKRFGFDLSHVILPQDSYHATLDTLGWPGTPPVFRQENGVILINSDAAFEAGGTRLTQTATEILTNAFICELYRQMAQTKMSQLLPVRRHHDQNYISTADAAAAFADIVFRLKLDDPQALARLPDDQRRLMNDHTRLLADNHRRESRIGNLNVELIAHLITHTVVTYANLLENRINPLLANPIHVADEIRELAILFDRKVEDGGHTAGGVKSALAAVISFFGDDSLLNDPRVMFVTATDDEDKMPVFESDILHELVHVAANNNLIADLARIAARHHPENTPEARACADLSRDRRYLMELLTDWLREDTVLKGRPDDASWHAPATNAPLTSALGWNHYRAGHATTAEGVEKHGDSFIAPFLGKPDSTDPATRAELAASTWPVLIDACQHALAKIRQRGEWQ